MASRYGKQSQRVYSDAQKIEALRIYLEEGPVAASKATGIQIRAIYRWAAAERLAAPGNTEVETAAKERAHNLRLELKVLLMEQAVAALHAMDQLVPKLVTSTENRVRTESYEMVPADARDKKELALAAAVLIDKFRLEMGEATARTEHHDLESTPDEAKRDVARAAYLAVLEGGSPAVGGGNGKGAASNGHAALLSLSLPVAAADGQRPATAGAEGTPDGNLSDGGHRGEALG